MSDRTIQPSALFAYADRFARRNEYAGRGTQYPTMRQAAVRFRCKLDDIEDATQDYQEDGYLGLACAVAIPGVGSADITPRGAWLVEAYK
jgi:hypothetical protein